MSVCRNNIYINSFISNSFEYMYLYMYLIHMVTYFRVVVLPVCTYT